MEVKFKAIEKETVENRYQMKLLQKDSEALQVERARGMQLVIDLTKAKEKEDNLVNAAKEIKRELKEI